MESPTSYSSVRAWECPIAARDASDVFDRRLLTDCGPALDGIVSAAARVAGVDMAVYERSIDGAATCVAAVGCRHAPAPHVDACTFDAAVAPVTARSGDEPTGVALSPRRTDLAVHDGDGTPIGHLRLVGVSRRELSDTQLATLDGLVVAIEQLVGSHDASRRLRELGTSVALFEAGFEHATVGMQLLGGDGQYLRVNRAFADLIGRSIDDVVGRNWRDFTHPVDVARISSFGAGDGGGFGDPLAPATDPSATDLKRYLRPDGSVVWALVTVVPVLVTEPHEPEEYVHFSQVVDITETVDARVRSEELEREVTLQEQRFHMAWEHAPVGMAVVDGRGQVLDVNHGLCELTLRPRGELLNSSLADVVERLDAHRNGIVVRSDGSVRDVQVRSAHVENVDGSEEEILQFVDISALAQHERVQRELLERQRATLEAARQLDRFKSSLVSTVSHELRTPLSSMIGYLELLEDDGGLTERQSRLVEVVERNSQRLLSVVEDLLITSGLEHRGLQVRARPIDVAELLGRVIEVMRPIASRAEVELLVATRPGLEPVAGDPKMVERVLVNLVSNGIKFTPPGGTVQLAARPGDVGSDIVIDVTDTGMGIPLDEQPQLFQRFFRARRAEDEMVPGSGLGLSIASEIVHAHHGTIDLRSESGVGTTVSVALPTIAAAREAEHMAVADVVAGQPAEWGCDVSA